MFYLCAWYQPGRRVVVGARNDPSRAGAGAWGARGARGEGRARRTRSRRAGAAGSRTTRNGNCRPMMTTTLLERTWWSHAFEELR